VSISFRLPSPTSSLALTTSPLHSDFDKTTSMYAYPGIPIRVLPWTSFDQGFVGWKLPWWWFGPSSFELQVQRSPPPLNTIPRSRAPHPVISGLPGLNSRRWGGGGPALAHRAYIRHPSVSIVTVTSTAIEHEPESRGRYCRMDATRHQVRAALKSNSKSADATKMIGRSRCEGVEK
jgi:hypothetical protein